MSHVAFEPFINHILSPSRVFCCSFLLKISYSFLSVSGKTHLFCDSLCSHTIHFFPFMLRQEDKEPVFDSVKTILGMLEVSAEFAQNITYNRDRIKQALPAGHLDATTLADYLVRKASLSTLFVQH